VTSRCAVLIPVYNNEQSVATVIDRVKTQIDRIIVVNDGSTDRTGEILSTRTDIELIVHESNRGKGAALRTGFEYAFSHEVTHVLTIDADGQHNCDEIPLFLEKLTEDSESIWIGARTIYGSGKAPFKNRLGRWFGNIWIRLFTGFDLHDTQSGYRLYPLAHLEPLEIKTNRYDYEQEVLLEAAWAGVSLKEFAIQQIYQSREDRVSHFHPLTDFLRIAKVHVRAMIRHFNPFVSIKVEGKNAGEKLRNLVVQEMTSHTTPFKASLALAVGVFFGVFPIHGFQVVTLMFVATKLKMNRPIAFLGVNISAPPLLPFLIFAAIKVGDVFLPGSIQIAEMSGTLIEKGGAGVLAFIVGSAILAPLFAAATFAISYPLFIQINRSRTK